MTHVKTFTELKPCQRRTACKLSWRCQGKCPKCGKCVAPSEGGWRGVEGLARLCSDLSCTFSELIPEKEDVNV